MHKWLIGPGTQRLQIMLNCHFKPAFTSQRQRQMIMSLSIVGDNFQCLLVVLYGLVKLAFFSQQFSKPQMYRIILLGYSKGMFV